MNRSLVVLFLLCVVTVCGAVDRGGQLDDIREATFRYQFKKNASGQQQNAKVYFLTLFNQKEQQDEDPEDKFMKRFDGHKPRVAKVSQSKSSMPEGVQDKKTGEHGLIFTITAIRWKSDEEVEVDGGYYEGSLSSSGNTYFLKRKGGKWIVERDDMHWIS